MKTQVPAEERRISGDLRVFNLRKSAGKHSNIQVILERMLQYFGLQLGNSIFELI